MWLACRPFLSVGLCDLIWALGLVEVAVDGA